MFWIFLLLAILAVLALVGVDILALVAIILIIVAIIFIPAVAAILGPMLPAAIGGVLAGGSYWVAGLLFFGAYLIDPETTIGIVEDVAEAVGEAAKIVADVVTDVTSSSIMSFLSTPVGLAAASIGLFWLFGSKDKTSEPLPIKDRPSKTQSFEKGVTRYGSI